MTQDKSREKSLLFLLSTNARSLVVPTEHKSKLHESVGSLQVEDAGDKWLISARVGSNAPKIAEVAKDKFIFYPVKSAARYETNPAVLNKNSAQEVLLSLFADYGVRVSGKKSEPLERHFTDFFSFNLITVSAITLLAMWNLEQLSAVLVIAQMLFSTKKHHNSAKRRWALIVGVVAPTLGFLFLHFKSSNNIQIVFLQVSLILALDSAIRVESRQMMKFKLEITRKIIFAGLVFIIILLQHSKLSVILLSIMVLICDILLINKNTATFRNILVIFYLMILAIYVIAAIVQNPYKLLLLPYLIYVAIYETLFGNNRNPAKLAFGALCLAI